MCSLRRVAIIFYKLVSLFGRLIFTNGLGEYLNGNTNHAETTTARAQTAVVLDTNYLPHIATTQDFSTGAPAVTHRTSQRSPRGTWKSTSLMRTGQASTRTGTAGCLRCSLQYLPPPKSLNSCSCLTGLDQWGARTSSCCGMRCAYC